MQTRVEIKVPTALAFHLFLLRFAGHFRIAPALAGELFCVAGTDGGQLPLDAYYLIFIER